VQQISRKHGGEDYGSSHFFSISSNEICIYINHALHVFMHFTY